MKIKYLQKYYRKKAIFLFHSILSRHKDFMRLTTIRKRIRRQRIRKRDIGSDAKLVEIDRETKRCEMGRNHEAVECQHSVRN